MIEYNDKVYKRIESAGVAGIVVGVITIVSGIALGVISIVFGGILLKLKGRLID